MVGIRISFPFGANGLFSEANSLLVSGSGFINVSGHSLKLRMVSEVPSLKTNRNRLAAISERIISQAGFFRGELLVSGRVFNGCEPGSPKRWDRWHSPSPNWQYIPLIVLAFVWGVICYRSHLLGEPGSQPLKITVTSSPPLSRPCPMVVQVDGGKACL